MYRSNENGGVYPLVLPADLKSVEEVCRVGFDFDEIFAGILLRIWDRSYG
jgi:hypothetical protein